MTRTNERKSEEDRFTRWVSQHGSAVRGYLRALVRYDDEAEDLYQDVFRRAWNARQRYRENGSARAYLLRIADRLVCDRARRQNHEITLDSQTWQHVEPQAETEPPDELAGRAEAEQQLAAALNALTPPQQRVLLLRYYGQLTFAEIANTMNCPLNTVLSHSRRGLLTLRELLAESSS